MTISGIHLREKRIIVATKYLTNFTETQALATGTAPEVATFLLKNIKLRHGAPGVLPSDLGHYFISDVVQNLVSLCHDIYEMTTAYHPQTNGPVQAFKGILAYMLFMYVDKDQNNCGTVLPFVTFAYKSCDRITGISSFCLLYGHDTPTLNLFHPSLSGRKESMKSLWIAMRSKYGSPPKTRMEFQLHRPLCYGDTQRSVHYNLGELVWIWAPIRQVGLSSKLMPRYTDPQKVADGLADVNYLVTPTVRPADRPTPAEYIVHMALKEVMHFACSQPV